MIMFPNSYDLIIIQKWPFWTAITVKIWIQCSVNSVKCEYFL